MATCPAREVAAEVTVTLISLSVSQLTRAVNESAPGIRRKLARYTMRRAGRYQVWHRAQCLLIDAVQAFPTFSGAFRSAGRAHPENQCAGAGLVLW